MVYEITDHALALPPIFAKHLTLNQEGLDTKFDVLKMKAHLKNAVGCIPFLAMEALEIKRIYEIADHALALPAFFCQTVNPISTKGAWTPNLTF